MGHAGLDGAEAPHGATGWVVGPNHNALHVSRRHPVGPSGEAGGVGDHRSTGRGVGPSVEQQPGLHADQRPVGLRVVAVPELGWVAVHVSVEALLPAVDHLHRAAGAQGQQTQVDVETEVLAGTERPTHPGQGQAHQLGIQTQAGRHLVPVHVEPLGGHVQLDASVLSRHGQARLRAQEGLVLHAHLVRPLDDHQIVAVGGCRIAVAEVDATKKVPIGVDGRRRLGQGRVDQGLSDLVVDHDGGQGSTDRFRVVGSHDGHRLALVTDHVGSQDRLVGVVQPVGGRTGNVFVGQDGVDPGHGHSRADIDGPNPG